MQEFIPHFLRHAESAAETYDLDTREILVELGKRKMVGGQEDMIVDVALDLIKKEITVMKIGMTLPVMEPDLSRQDLERLDLTHRCWPMVTHCFGRKNFISKSRIYSYFKCSSCLDQASRDYCNHFCLNYA